MRKSLLFCCVVLFLLGNVAFSQTYKEMKTEYEKEVSPKGMKKYNPTTATLLSFIVPGIGQMYVGEPTRGLGFLLGSIAATAVTIIGITPKYDSVSCDSSYYCQPYTNTSLNSPGLALVGLVSSIGITIWSMVDASKVANVKNSYYNQKMNEEKVKQNEPENKTSFLLPQFSPVVIRNQSELVPGVGLSIKF